MAEGFLYVNRKKPVVTYALIGINVAMYLAELVLQTFFMSHGQMLLVLGAKENTLITVGQYWRLLTAAFLHSGLSHIACNMFALFIWGRNAEALLGRARYLAVYLVSGAFGTLLSYLCSPAVAVGASGAIFGLFGALLYFRLRHRRMFDQVFGIQVLIIIGMNLAMGFMGQGVDNFGHIGGLLGGFAAAYAVGLYGERMDWKHLLCVLGLVAAFAALLCIGVVRYSALLNVPPFSFLPINLWG